MVNSMLLLGLLSGFVIALLGIILMVHYDPMLGIILAITGCVCVLRVMYHIQEYKE